MIECREEWLGELDEPEDRAKQCDPGKQCKGESDGAGLVLLMRGQFACQDRDEDNVVDPENDFQNREGEKTDPESGCNHLAHAICCLMFILDADESGKPLAPAEGKAVDPKWDGVPKVNYAFMTPPGKEEEFPTMMYNVCASPTQEIMGYSSMNMSTETNKSNYEFQNRSSISLAGVAKPYKYTTLPVRTGLGGNNKQ